MIGERPQSLLLGDSIVNTSLGVRWGSSFATPALSVALIM
jgi:hypothetical protein